MESAQMHNIITNVIMGSFMVWIIVVVTDNGVVKRNYSAQFITKQACDKEIKAIRDLAEGRRGPYKNKCVKVPYQRK